MALCFGDASSIGYYKIAREGGPKFVPLNNATVYLIRRHSTNSVYGEVQNGQSALFIVVFVLKLKHHAVLSCQQVRKAIILKARCKIRGDSFTLQSLLVIISIYFFLVKRNFAKKGVIVVIGNATQHEGEVREISLTSCVEKYVFFSLSEVSLSSTLVIGVL